MMEETYHSVLSRFERTRNSLERILTIIFFLTERDEALPLSPKYPIGSYDSIYSTFEN